MKTKDQRDLAEILRLTKEAEPGDGRSDGLPEGGEILEFPKK